MEGYVGAPYNFVSFSDNVYEYPDGKQTAHDCIGEELVTGEISYEVMAETPIIVDDGNGQFTKDARGRYAIPGSTIRGLIRNNVQILGLSGFDEDIDDYALMYRNVAYGIEKKYYNDIILGAKQLKIGDGKKKYNIGVLCNVRAGYVSNENGKYIIYQTCIDSIKTEFQKMNYYVLSEKKIIGDYLKNKDGERKFQDEVFRPEGKSILQHEFEEFQRKEKEVKGKRRVQYIGKENPDYKPYCIEISYEVQNEKDIAAVGLPGTYSKEGFVVSTGKMQQKKVVYIIPEIDKKKLSIKIPDEDVRAFQIDMKKKENTLKQFGGRKYFDLPEAGETKPIFYIKLKKRLYFGFTPRLRLFYDHTIKKGLKQNTASGKIDYSKAMFGYTNPEGSCKSRLSFSDAVARGEPKVLGSKELILSEPKPSSYLDYLKPREGKGVTYNTKGFELRGVKQYWLHKELAPVKSAPIKQGVIKKKNEKVTSSFQPLDRKTVFAGKIRFRNLKQDELGLLLWAVRLEKDSWMNVGKAKAYGYGNISVKITEARQIDLAKAYFTEGILNLDPFKPIEIDEAIQNYKEEINRFLGSSIDELPLILEFFMMKDSKHIPEYQKIRYMSIDNREYQSRKAVLPSIESIWGDSGEDV